MQRGPVDEGAVDLAGIARQVRLERVEIVAVNEAAVQPGVADGSAGIGHERAERRGDVVVADKLFAAKIEYSHVDKYGLV